MRPLISNWMRWSSLGGWSPLSGRCSAAVSSRRSRPGRGARATARTSSLSLRECRPPGRRRSPRCARPEWRRPGGRSACFVRACRGIQSAGALIPSGRLAVLKGAEPVAHTQNADNRDRPGRDPRAISLGNGFACVMRNAARCLLLGRNGRRVPESLPRRPAPLPWTSSHVK
jgi:hypothetical protein